MMRNKYIFFFFGDENWKRYFYEIAPIIDSLQCIGSIKIKINHDFFFKIKLKQTVDIITAYQVLQSIHLAMYID